MRLSDEQRERLYFLRTYLVLFDDFKESVGKELINIIKDALGDKAGFLYKNEYSQQEVLKMLNVVDELYGEPAARLSDATKQSFAREVEMLDATVMDGLEGLN